MNKICPTCSGEFHCKPSALSRRVYCSKKCMGSGYKLRTGVLSSTWKHSNTKSCPSCGQTFHGRKFRSYCSKNCSDRRGSIFLGDRFWSSVEKSDRCWNWKKSKDKDGYGKFSVHGIARRAHRALWEMLFGSVPDKLQVCHHCDNPSCIRPDHLFVGTQSDNMRDCVSKGRHALQRPRKKK